MRKVLCGLMLVLTAPLAMAGPRPVASLVVRGPVVYGGTASVAACPADMVLVSGQWEALSGKVTIPAVAEPFAGREGTAPDHWQVISGTTTRVRALALCGKA